MNSILVAGIFTIIGAAVGAVTMFFVQMELRKEKFKEIVYKERLAVYEEAVHGCRNLFLAYLDVLKDPQGIDKLRKLTSEASQLQEVIGRRWIFVSDAVYTNVGKMISNALDPVDMPLTFDDDPIKTFERIRDFDVILHYGEALDAMRKELQIDAISDEIKKTIEFATYVKLYL